MSAQSFRSIIGMQPSTASAKDSVLVIIDAQNEYAKGQLKLKNVDNTRKEIKSLLDRYRAAGGQVIHVVHEVPAGAPVFTPGTELAAEFDELKPEGSEATVTKNHPGSFTGTNLEESIKKTGLNKLVIVGYMAHVCVNTTARQAAERGYDVLIASDAVSTRDVPGATAEELHKVVMAELGDAFATIVKAADVQ